MCIYTHTHTHIFLFVFRERYNMVYEKMKNIFICLLSVLSKHKTGHNFLGLLNCGMGKVQMSEK